MYYQRIIDQHLNEWAAQPDHKPVLLRGARQVGKSTAVRHLGQQFENFVEINFEKKPQYKELFKKDLDVTRIVPLIASLSGQPITPGKTLLFLDEIQECPEAIMSLRFFKEDMPSLHVIAAGSLLEFAIRELPTFGVGRIHSMFMYPMTYDEFLMANGRDAIMQMRNDCDSQHTLPTPLHDTLVDDLRTYMLVGGMPESVNCWVKTHDYLQCQKIQDDLTITYEDDFTKYHGKVDPTLLRHTLHSAALQVTNKFVYKKVGDYRTSEVQKALDFLCLAGLLIPVTHTDANGLPLGSEANNSYQKFLLLDTGIMLRLLNMSLGNITEITTHILTSTASNLANKGPMAEMLAGLELLHYRSPNIRHELFYWVRHKKNAVAEIDYLCVKDGQVLPIEVKAGVQGGMKSLWAFMRDKHLTSAVRCSLENFGEIIQTDTADNDTERYVKIYPLYAISMLEKWRETR